MTDVISLAEVQYNLKRDPVTYKTDFVRYFENYLALEQSFACAPSQFMVKLEEVILFISQVIHFYPDYAETFSKNVIQILLSRSFGMQPRMRKAFMKAFMRLRTKDLIPMDKAIDVSFKLHRCQDKEVRQVMRTFLVHDIKRVNRHQKLGRRNSSVQSYLSKMIKDHNSTIGREAVLLLIRLFVKNVWSDARTANMLADACFAKRKKVYTPAVRFFLGQNRKTDEKDSDSESDTEVNKEAKIKQLRMGHRVGCKTRRRQKRLDRSIEHVSKAETRKKARKEKVSFANMIAINLLHDPQTFAERLFHKLERCTDRFEIRLFLLDLITRLIGLHKLLVLNLYPFLQRFLRPQQREVTRLLLFAAQASHDEVPPDVMGPVLRVIADNFVTERASSEAIAVGLNAIREICARCPYAVSPDLLSDLIQYRTYRNKNVVASARSLMRLFRQINPKALPRKERGRPTEAQVEILGERASGLALEFGKLNAAHSVPGAEALVVAENLSKDVRKAKQSPIDVSQPKSVTEMEGDEELKSDAEESEIDLGSEGDESSDSNANDDSEEDASEDSEFEDSIGNSQKGTTKQTKSNSKTKNSDDGWIDVDQSSDGETEVEKQLSKMDQGELTTKAIDVASSRIFTQEEFEAMRRYEQSKQKRFASVGSGKKRRIEETISIDDSDDEDGVGSGSKMQLASMSDITRLAKRPKLSKAERLEAVQDGRAGREKYGYKINRLNPNASTTNREKAKNKAFNMIKHKVKTKAKRSFRDKQIALRDQLLHRMKHMR